MLGSRCLLNFVRVCLSRLETGRLEKIPFTVNPFPIAAQSVILYNHTITRNYAKGKNKIKEDKGKGKKKNIQVNESFLEQAINVEKYKTELENCVNSMKEIYISQISLRSTTGSIESLSVSFEGQKYPLIELGQIVRKNPKTVVVNMNAFPQAIPAVLKAIASSGMNLSPQQDGTSLFIPVPKVTREYRENLAKNAKAQFIKCRDNIKNIQNKYLKDIKKKEKDGLSEDDSFQMSDQVKHLGDQFVTQAENLFHIKETELLGDS